MTIDCCPKGQVIVVVISVIKESAFLNHQATGVLTGPARIPTQWALTSQLLNDLDRFVKVLSFRRLRYVSVVNPAVTV